MKKRLMFFFALFLIVSCGKKTENTKSDKADSMHTSIGKTSSEEALLNAIEARDLTLVRHALKQGASIDCHFTNNENPLTYAIKIGNSEIVNELLKRSANPNQANTLKEFPLHLAILEKNLIIFNRILQEDTINLEYLDQNGNRAIHLAIENEMDEMVFELATKGANPHSINTYGMSPMRLAERARLSQVVNFFKKLNKLNKADNKKELLNEYINEGLYYLVKYYITNFPSINQLDGQNLLAGVIKSDTNQKILILRMLLDHGLNPNGEPKDLNIPVLQAAKLGDFESLQRLYLYGADINKYDDYGLSPLIYAVGNLDLTMVDYLLKHGAEMAYYAEINGRKVPIRACRYLPRRRHTVYESMESHAEIQEKLGCRY